MDDFVAGWVSGVAGLALTQPVDYVLTRLQSGSGAEANPSASGVRGVLGMWRGIMPLAATVPLNNAMLMHGYGVGKSWAASNNEASLAPIFLGGCAGGFVQSFLQSPVELLKVRLQLAAASEMASAVELTQTVLKVPASGLSATLLRDVVPHGVWFASYEWIKRVLERRAAAAAVPPLVATGALGGEPSPLNTPDQLAAGSFAALTAWVVGYPADLLKTRCQMVGGPTNLVEAAVVVRAEGGLLAFYHGLGLKLLRAIPMSAVGFLAYERTMQLLAKRRTATTS